MTVNAITDTKKGRTWIAPTYLHTTRDPDRAIVGSFQNMTGHARQKNNLSGPSGTNPYLRDI